jgi:hypothetical protein
MTNELDLYHSDRAAWLALVAPRMPALIDTETDAELAQGWALMSRDFQVATWAHLSEAQRERIRRLRKAAA